MAKKTINPVVDCEEAKAKRKTHKLGFNTLKLVLKTLQNIPKHTKLANAPGSQANPGFLNNKEKSLSEFILLIV